MGLLIFDCDGVLRSFCWNAVYEAYKEIARHLGREPEDFWKDAADFRQWVDYIEWTYNLERMGLPKGSDYTQIRNIFHRVCDPRIHTFDWVEEVLRELSSRHHVTVLSASISSSLSNTLDFVSGYLSHIVASEHVTNVKPDPEGIFLLMNKFGAKPENTWMIGDAWVDIVAGKNARVKTAGVPWGMSEPEELLIFEPDYMFEDPFELLML